MSTVHDPLGVSDITIGIPVTDPARAAELYRVLLGQANADRSWAVRNGGVTLLDRGEAPAVDLAVSDLDQSLTLLGRRGLQTIERRPGSFRIVGAEPVGVTAPLDAIGEGAHAAVTIDHVVLTHPDVEAAVALYGGRLGLDLRLVKNLSDGIAQLFFRTRTTIVEVVAGAAVADEERFGGIAWRADDIESEQRRLTGAGLHVSEVRDGRKPGSAVCTVRDADLGTPTLLIQQSPLRGSDRAR